MTRYFTKVGGYYTWDDMRNARTLTPAVADEVAHGATEIRSRSNVRSTNARHAGTAPPDSSDRIGRI